MSEYSVQESHDKLDGYPAPSQAKRVFGHDSQADFLATAYASGRMHHAFLFDGPVGIGKAALAFIFARHIISYPDYKDAPAVLDGTTTQSIIRQTAMGAHAQVLHLTRPLDQKTGKHKTQLTVDETRKIGHFLSHTIAGNGYRIVIVDPVNDMNTNAANALLKNLEEPTPRTVFILIAQSSGRLLPTIRSRCLSLRFHALDNASLSSWLQDTGLSERLDAASLDDIVARANGSPRVAAMLLDGGGLEIIKSAQSILTGHRFDASLALKIGEVVSTRDAEPLFHLLCDFLLEQISALARGALSSDLVRAKELSQLHTVAGDKIRTALIYNLDKRQTLLDILLQMHKTTDKTTFAG
jgi:DNA polymerase III subunit delta'